LTPSVALMQRQNSASFVPGNDPSSGSLQPHFDTTFGPVERQTRFSPRRVEGACEKQASACGLRSKEQCKPILN
ncbi:hypothetical protein, partial [Mesorhizobium sp.]|uniref:hypothetical protein n=1 Tax=Mesorhizobium sp. TaxID=1871066 RepID=UPI0025D31C35